MPVETSSRAGKLEGNEIEKTSEWQQLSTKTAREHGRMWSCDPEEVTGNQSLSSVKLETSVAISGDFCSL